MQIDLIEINLLDGSLSILFDIFLDIDYII